jgi:hypothetical protein
MDSWIKEILLDVHDYYENMKAKVTIFNMNDRASIWWEDLKNMKMISERKVTCESI